MSYYIAFDGPSGAGKGKVISWCATFLKANGKHPVVLEDNKLDPLRDSMVRMIEWCKKNRVDRQTFFLPLFAAGGAIVDRALDEWLSQYDFVLRDRCTLVTNLAYQPAAGVFTQEQIWDLYINHVGLRIPNRAVIVDVEPEVAARRMNSRPQIDIGVGGKMSGDAGKKARICELFRAIPQNFAGRLDAIIVSNNQDLADNDPVVEVLCKKIFEGML